MGRGAGRGKGKGKGGGKGPKKGTGKGRSTFMDQCVSPSQNNSITNDTLSHGSQLPPAPSPDAHSTLNPADISWGSDIDSEKDTPTTHTPLTDPYNNPTLLNAITSLLGTERSKIRPDHSAGSTATNATLNLSLSSNTLSSPQTTQTDTQTPPPTQVSYLAKLSKSYISAMKSASESA